MKNKQTAVEWLQKCMSAHLSHEQIMQFEGLFQQAKTTEQEQIKDAYMVCDDSITLEESEIYAEIYYNRTYNTNK